MGLIVKVDQVARSDRNHMSQPAGVLPHDGCAARLPATILRRSPPCAAAVALNKHMNWLTGPGIDPGKWNAPVDLSMRHLRATLALAEADGTRDPQE